MVRASRATPSVPQNAATGRESASAPSREARPPRRGRQLSASKREVRQVTARAKKETSRTIAAAQAKSHSGSGRSPRATSAWPNITGALTAPPAPSGPPLWPARFGPHLGARRRERTGLREWIGPTGERRWLSL